MSQCTVRCEVEWKMFEIDVCANMILGISLRICERMKFKVCSAVHSCC